MLLHNNSGQCEINELWLLLLSTGLTFKVFVIVEMFIGSYIKLSEQTFP